MQKQNLNYMLVGIFTINLFGLLLVVLFKVTGNVAESDYYYSRYSNITGINTGTAVTYGGYRIGWVEDIRAVRQKGRTHFELKLAITSGWKIPADSVARITSPGMLSDKQINIEEGKSNQYLKPGDHLRGREEASIMAILNSVAVEIQNVSEESIKPFLAVLQKHADKIGGTLGQQLPELAKNAMDLITEIRGTAQGLQQMVGKDNQSNIKETLKNVRVFSERLNNMSTDFAKMRARINSLLKNSSATVNENRQDLKQAMSNMRKVMESMAGSIDSITYNLESASRNMSEFARQIRENPALLLGGTAPSDKQVR